MTVRGEVIADRYELRTPLGRGAMAEVWEGYDVRLERRVAVKLVRRSNLPLGADHDVVFKRFQREARVTANLEHPGVPTVYDVGVHDGDAYLVMQLVIGEDLGVLVAERGPLPVAWAAAIAAQICGVLSAAHAASLVHRDLKPTNVMLCRDGTVKVLDFGIAAILDAVDLTRLTATGQVLGTPRYLAPELASGGEAVPATDMYALGCLLYELLAGRPPFVAERSVAVINQHLNDPPPPLRSLRPDVPEDLARLVADLLAKDPRQRPGDAAQVYWSLVDHVLTAPVVVPEVGPDPTAPFSHHRPRSAPGAQPAPTAGVGPGVPPVAPAGAAGERPTPSGGPPGPRRPADAKSASALLDRARQEAVTLLDEGRVTLAGQLLHDAVTRAGQALGTGDPEMVDARLALARIHLVAEDHGRALAEFQRLLPDLVRHYGADHEFVWSTRRSIMECHLAMGDRAAAASVLEELLSAPPRTGGVESQLAELVELRQRLRG